MYQIPPNYSLPLGDLAASNRNFVKTGRITKFIVLSPSVGHPLQIVGSTGACIFTHVLEVGRYCGGTSRR